MRRSNKCMLHPGGDRKMSKVSVLKLFARRIQWIFIIWLTDYGICSGDKRFEMKHWIKLIEKDNEHYHKNNKICIMHKHICALSSYCEWPSLLVRTAIVLARTALIRMQLVCVQTVQKCQMLLLSWGDVIIFRINKDQGRV